MAIEAIVIRHANLICQSIEKIDKAAKQERGPEQEISGFYADRASYHGVDMDIKAMALGLGWLGKNSMDSAPLLNATSAVSREIARLSKIIGPTQHLLARVKDELGTIKSALQDREDKDVDRKRPKFRRPSSGPL